MRTLLHVRPVGLCEIYDLAGVRVGTVDTLILDASSGAIRFAWTTFFAISCDQVVLPWSALSYSNIRMAFISLVTNSRIQAAPVIRGNDLTVEAEQLLTEHYRTRP